MFQAFTAGAEMDVSPITTHLDNQRLRYEIILQENGAQELWVHDAELAKTLQLAYQKLQEQQAQTLSFRNLKKVPVTAISMLLCLLVAIWTQLGDTRVEPFLIAEIVYYPRGWTWQLDAEHILRLFLPTFLHFGVMHLVFNMLALWYLGNNIERKMGALLTLSIYLVIALVSNVVQLQLSGPLFGGFSGVVYGLIAVAFIAQQSGIPFGFPKGLFVFAAVWLLLGFTPLFGVVDISMANGAHLSGVVAGLILGAIFSGWMRASKRITQ